MRGATLLLLVLLPLAGCRSTRPRYIVTTEPLYFLGERHSGFCVAVDPDEASGVWWWEPGRSGCSSRSTGPGVFPANAARVARSAHAVDVSFEIELMVADPRIVTLEIAGSDMREVSSGLRARTERRATLDLPESVPANPRR